MMEGRWVITFFLSNGRGYFHRTMYRTQNEAMTQARMLMRTKKHSTDKRRPYVWKWRSPSSPGF